MGRFKKKGQEGTAVDYMTRSRAVRKLQISLQEFRKLCILKGVYPREPKRKVAGKDKTYYLTKDIMFLAHDPVLIKLREQKTWRKRMTKAQGRNEKLVRLREIERQKPKYSLAHIVKERYPTFADALRDLDDTLCLVHLFGQLTSDSKIPPKRISSARRLSLEFQSYIIRQRALRKVFLSIKGIYYQAEVMGERLIWIVPYKFSQEVPRFVDVGVMNNFFEFSETLMGFVNYKLFHSLGLHYPPDFDADKEDNGEGLFAVILSPEGATQEAESDEDATTYAAPTGEAKSLPESLTLRIKDQEEMDEEDDEDEMDNDEEAVVFQTEGQGDSKEMEQFKNLFSKCVFFLSREVPKESLEFVIRSFGGQVSWDGEHAPYDADDARITHYIIDREQQPSSEYTRAFVQPQWVYDSINSQILLPVEEYGIKMKLPPHLSPFVDNEAEGYTPQRAKEINRMVATAQGEAYVDSDQEGDEEGDSDDEARQEEQYQKELEAERKGISYSDARNVVEEEVSAESSDEEEVQPKKKSKKQKALEEEEQQKQLAKSLIPSRRRRRLYDNIQRSKKVKEERNNVLLQKSRMLEKARRRSSTSK